MAWHPRQHAFRAAASLEEILQRSNLVDIVGHVEANWNLVETDAARAYDLIEAASLRYHHLATRPSRPSEMRRITWARPSAACQWAHFCDPNDAAVTSRCTGLGTR